MSLTILEVLENARHNLQPDTMAFQKSLGMEQLSNAIKLLDQGKGPSDDFDEEELED